MEYKVLSLILMLSAVLLSFGAVIGQESREIRKTFALNRDEPEIRAPSGTLRSL